MSNKNTPEILPPALDQDLSALQRKVVTILAAGQILGGLGVGAGVSIGALLLTRVSGTPSWSGFAAAAGTFGAALLAVPLVRLAQRRGRRISLTAGALIAVLGASVTILGAAAMSLATVLVGMGLMGAATALSLQSRFAATDIATHKTRGRDLSIVVWSTTVGAVAGPNLIEPGEALGRALGLPALTGGFFIALVAQAAAAVLYFVALRPDPLLLANAQGKSNQGKGSSSGIFQLLRSSSGARRAVLTVALSHTVMVTLMSMTPVHLTSHGGSVSVVGLVLSLHIAGMYALSPVFGFLTDRYGSRLVVLGGQFLLGVALVLSWLAADVHVLVTASLILLGLGWSAAVIAGSTMVTESVSPSDRTGVQGLSDLVMNVLGAAGAALAGPVLTLAGFNGLSAGLIVLVVAVVLLNRRPTAAEVPATVRAH
jgi:MFS family permease